MQTRSGFCYRKPEAHGAVKRKAYQHDPRETRRPVKRKAYQHDPRETRPVKRKAYQHDPRETRRLKRKAYQHDPRETIRRKRSRQLPAAADFFDGLPDDLVTCILCWLSMSASCPSDLINIMLTCKRLNELGLDPIVLSKASTKALGIRAKNWNDEARRFLQRCAVAGNLEACYILGMIKFYCLQHRVRGAALMARAAMGNHPAALYSLSIIQFNGSGGSKQDKDLRAGAALCARSAFLGHVDALRELGHCLQDGYGVPRNVAEGRRFLVHANARELLIGSGLIPSPNPKPVSVSDCLLRSDYGCRLPVREVHPANRFLVEWFGEKWFMSGWDGLQMCSNTGCGRPETRRHEFRRCSVCSSVDYCSRACQAQHWKYVHKFECRPIVEALVGFGGVEVN